ncbi:MAG: thiamine-phosphate kinase, partial [Gammaproteobacteria bacterium]|nr:thiamine-phosphate kinase [Gammaproteobacteria bacterium]
AKTFDVDLVGGDMTHGSEFVISVQVIGDVEPECAISRSGAKPGDGIYVSGTPGDAAAGLSILLNMKPMEEFQGWMNYLVQRFSRPDSRIALGQAIAPMATAAIDVSDGLYSDIDKLLRASGVAGSIEVNSIPLSEELRSNMSLADAHRFALSGGEDFELCFTAPVDELNDTRDVAGVSVTRIGSVTEGSCLSCTLGGEPYEYHDDGYRHFR